MFEKIRNSFQKLIFGYKMEVWNSVRKRRGILVVISDVEKEMTKTATSLSLTHQKVLKINQFSKLLLIMDCRSIMAYRRQKLDFAENESGGWIPGLGDNKPRPRKYFTYQSRTEWSNFALIEIHWR